MLLLTSQQKGFARDSIVAFRGLLQRELLDTIGNLPNYQPPIEIQDITVKLNLLQNALDRDRPDGGVVLTDEVLPTLKPVIAHYRRQLASQIEAHKGRTTHPELLERLDEELTPVDDLIQQAWFDSVPAMSKPRLTDYFSIDRIERRSRVRSIRGTQIR